MCFFSRAVLAFASTLRASASMSSLALLRVISYCSWT